LDDQPALPEVISIMGMRWTALVRDARLPAAVAVIGAIELALLHPDGWVYGIAVECAGCSVLVWRRTFPLAACTLAPIVTLMMPLLGPRLDDASAPLLIVVIGSYSLARHLHGLHGLLGLAMLAGAVALVYVLVDKRDHNVSDVFFVSAMLLPPYILGRLTRRLAEQAGQLERQQQQVKDEAARAERARIARDLHDVIAHSVSAMVVQTAVAEDLVRRDPDRAVEILESVASTGRRALAETGRLLHVIRDDSGELGLLPTPGLDRLTELVEQFRGSGLQVDLRVEGLLTPLPIGVDVSAYRIVQEALSNALRYGADQQAVVRVIRGPDSLSIASENTAAHGRVTGSGLGLAGIAERVALLGGTLTHGLAEDGRFVLSAVLPFGGGEPA
jgi:signal transduction histidine kinase